jgi:hypothetical protein
VTGWLLALLSRTDLPGRIEPTRNFGALGEFASMRCKIRRKDSHLLGGIPNCDLQINRTWEQHRDFKNLVESSSQEALHKLANFLADEIEANLPYFE